MKFIVTGLSAAALEFILFIILNHLFNGGMLVLAQTISFVAGFVISFTLNRTWVFKSDGKLGPELLKYLMLLAINLVLTNITLSVLVNQVHVVEWTAKLIVMVMVAVWNYIIFQKLIFRTKK